MKAEVVNKDGQSTGRQVELPDELFGIVPNEHVIYLAVKQYLAAQRQGTHKAKERGEIKGSTKKIKRQKGTGTARAGSMKNPLFKGGGRVFGPRPRDYSFKLNKKVKKIARNSALSILAREEKIVVIENFDLDAPKTKDYFNILKNLELDGKKSLLVLEEDKSNVVRAARNIPKAKVTSVNTLNTYNILDTHKLILSEGAIAKLS